MTRPRPRPLVLHDWARQIRGSRGADRLRECADIQVVLAMFGNTARGAIVDGRGFVEALRDGPSSAVGLDVEPLPKDSPPRSLPKVVLTPHIGWPVKEAFEEFVGAAGQLNDYLVHRLDPTDLAFRPPTERSPRCRGQVTSR